MNHVVKPGALNERVARALQDLLLAHHRYTSVVSRERGVGVTELLALGHLRDNGAVPLRDLGNRLGITSASVTALVDRLERAGHARRLAHPHDRRSLLVELTALGQSEVGSIFELPSTDVEAALNRLSPDAQDTVARFLHDITISFHARAAEISALDREST